jgi:hypothetical protein
LYSVKLVGGGQVMTEMVTPDDLCDAARDEVTMGLLADDIVAKWRVPEASA